MGALRVRLLVDTGVDDALALVAAVLHPGLDLAEAVAVGGNVPLDRVLTNTRFVLGLLGADTVPVTAGAARRADGSAFQGRAVHGSDGLAGLAPHLPPAAVSSESDDTVSAADAHGSDDDALLVCLGPLTTLLGWTPAAVVATYARPGQANHALDPVAAERVRATWQVRDVRAGPDAVRLPGGRPRTDLGRFVAALLDHRATRGVGLGDADAVLRLAGETRPADTMAEQLRTWEGVRA
ncbi:MAG: nucleoside hydrolase [Jiangellales bacterium]